MLTFLFTDVADSSHLWQQFPKEMSHALAAHDGIMKRVIPDHNGHIIKSTGDGVHDRFERITDASQAAVALQQELIAHPWEETGPLKVRIGLHTGDAEARDGDYYGPAVNKAARVCPSPPAARCWSPIFLMLY
jgi:class 3 adenylate cyclase